MVNEMKRIVFALLLFPVVAHAQCVETRDSTGDVISRSCVTKPLSAQDLNTLNDLAAQSQQQNAQQQDDEKKLADQAAYNRTMSQWEQVEPKCAQVEGSSGNSVRYKGKKLTLEKCQQLRGIIERLQNEASKEGLATPID